MPQTAVNFTELAARLEATNQAAQEALSSAKSTAEPLPQAVADEADTPRRIYATSITNTLTNCRVFISMCTAYGANYLSSNPRYTLASLTALADTADGMVLEVSKAEALYKYAVAHRVAEFEGLEPLCSLIVAEMQISGSPEDTISQVRTLLRSLRGNRKVPKDPNDPTRVYKSVSQQNYDDVTANFERLLLMVAEDANYNPAAVALQLVTLEAKLASLRTANTDVQTAKAALDAARILRNDCFNAEITGLVDTFLTAKNVVLTNFGRASEQYMKVKGLAFRRIDVR